jgi:hypothetical protein
MARQLRIPKYRRHSSSQARTTINGKERRAQAELLRELVPDPSHRFAEDEAELSSQG